MRILFHCASRDWSGSTRAFASLAYGLSQRGHAVTFVCPAESAVEQRLAFGQYEVLALGREAPLAALARFRRVLQERFIQVVCVHSESEQVAAAAAARWADRSAVLRRIPAGGTLALGRAARLSLRLTTTGFLFAAPGDLARSPRPPRARLAPVVVPLGVRPERYEAVRPASLAAASAPPAARVLVCVYDGAARARAANVIRVMALLAPHHPDLHLVFVGPGSDDEELRMHAASLRILPRASFLGARDDALAVLAMAELGWVAAEGDDGAFGALDLLGCRVPAIVERGTSAEPYVPDGIAGLVLSSGGAHDAAAAVARLLAFPDVRSAMGGAGFARMARDYGEAAMLDAFEQAATAASERSRW